MLMKLLKIMGRSWNVQGFNSIKIEFNMKTRLNYWLVENSNDDDKKQKGFKDVILEDLQFCEENVFILFLFF